MRPPIHINLSGHGLVFVDDNDAVGSLDDLPRKWLQHDSRDAGRDAPRCRIRSAVWFGLAARLAAGCVFSFGPRLKWRRIVFRPQAVIGVAYEPDAGKIRHMQISFCRWRLLRGSSQLNRHPGQYDERKN